MKLHVELHVKFRAFGIDFGTVNKTWDEPIPIPVPLPHATLIHFKDRGVELLVDLR